MNINMLMNQAKRMQAEMEKKQAEFNGKIFEKKFNGGAITLKMKGNFTIQSIEIDKDLLDPQEKDILEDMIKVSINEMIKEIKKEEAAAMPQKPGLGF